MTGVINDAHASGARVVLTVQSFAWSTTGLARQKALLGSSTARSNLATQITKAIRDRGADGVNLDFEPLASRLRRRVHLARAQDPLEAERGGPGLPADVRHDRLDRQLPDRGRHQDRRGRRDHGHGLRLPQRGVRRRRLDRADRRVRSTTSRDTLAAYLARVPAVQGHPRRAVLRPRLVDVERRAPRDQHLGHEVRGVGDRQLRHGLRLRQPVRTHLRRDRGRHVDRVPAPDLHAPPTAA